MLPTPAPQSRSPGEFWPAEQYLQMERWPLPAPPQTAGPFPLTPALLRRPPFARQHEIDLTGCALDGVTRPSGSLGGSRPWPTRFRASTGAFRRSRPAVVGGAHPIDRGGPKDVRSGRQQTQRRYRDGAQGPEPVRGDHQVLDACNISTLRQASGRSRSVQVGPSRATR
jgi:hypothetical protein